MISAVTGASSTLFIVKLKEFVPEIVPLFAVMFIITLPVALASGLSEISQLLPVEFEITRLLSATFD